MSEPLSFAEDMPPGAVPPVIAKHAPFDTLPPEVLDAIEQARAERQAAITTGQPHPGFLARANQAIARVPVAGKPLAVTLRGLGRYFSVIQPGLAELATGAIRKRLGNDDGTAQRFRSAMSDSPAGGLARLDAGFSALRDYRHNRESLFWGERFLGEVLFDPANLLGWGLAGKAAQATKAITPVSKLFAGIDKGDQAYIAATNLPFREASRLWRRWSPRRMAAQQAVQRNIAVFSVRAELDDKFRADAPGALTALFHEVDARVDAGTAGIADTSLWRAKQLIADMDATGANAADFFDSLSVLPARAATKEFLDRLRSDQEHVYNLFLQLRAEPEGSRGSARIVNALSRLPPEVRAKVENAWNAQGVRKWAGEQWYKFTNVTGASKTRGFGNTLATFVNAWPEAMLSTTLYGPFNVAEEILRTLGAGSGWSHRTAEGVRDLSAAFTDAIDRLPTKISVSPVSAFKGIGGTTQDDAMSAFGSLMQPDDIAGEVSQLLGRPSRNVNYLVLRTGKPAIDRITQLAGPWSVSWGNRMTAQFRRGFFVNRLHENIQREFSVIQSQDLQDFVGILQTATKLGLDRNTAAELMEHAILFADDPQKLRASLSMFTTQELNKRDAIKLVKANTWIPADVQDMLVEGIVAGTPLTGIDDLIERAVRKPMLDELSHHAEFVEAAISLFADRIEDVNKIVTPAQAVTAVHEAIQILSLFQHMPNVVRSVAAKRAERHPMTGPQLTKLWAGVDETVARLMNPDSPTMKALERVLAFIEAVGKKDFEGQHMDTLARIGVQNRDLNINLPKLWAEDQRVRADFFPERYLALGNNAVEREAFWRDYHNARPAVWREYEDKLFGANQGFLKDLTTLWQEIQQTAVGDESARAMATRFAAEDIQKAARSAAADSDAWLVFEDKIGVLTADLKKHVSDAPIRESQVAAVSDWLGKLADRSDALLPETRDALVAAKSRALDRTVETFKTEFTNYLDQTASDSFMRVLFPFWTYASRALPYLARKAVEKPGLGKVFAPNGTYWDYTENGYLPFSIAGYALAPIQGTVIGRLRRIYAPPYAKEYDGWYGTVDDIKTTGERYGFWLHPLLSGLLDVAGAAPGGRPLGGPAGGLSQLATENLPPVLTNVIEATIAGAHAIKQLATPEQREAADLLTREDRASPFDALDLIQTAFPDRWRDVDAHIDAASNGLAWSTLDDTERNSWRSLAALHRLLPNFLGIGTFKPDAFRELDRSLKAEATKLAKGEDPTWDDEKTEQWIRGGHSIADMPLSPAARRRIYDLEAYRLLSQVYEPLKPEQAQTIISTTRRIFTEGRRLRAQTSANANINWEARTHGYLKGKSWTSEYFDDLAAVSEWYRNSEANAPDLFLASADDRMAFRRYQGLKTLALSDADLVLRAYYSLTPQLDVAGRIDHEALDADRLALLADVKRELGPKVYAEVVGEIERSLTPIEKQFWEGFRTYMRPVHRADDPRYVEEIVAWANHDPKWGVGMASTIRRLSATHRELAAQISANRYNADYADPLERAALYSPATALWSEVLNDYRNYLRARDPRIQKWEHDFEDKS